jgi:hypothetical protein
VLAILIALIAIYFFTSKVETKRKKLVLGPFAILFAVIVYCHQIHSFEFFDQSRQESVRWDLANRLGESLGLLKFIPNPICTNTLIPNEDPYDYWSYYLTEIARTKVTLKYAKDSNAECTSYLDYRHVGREGELELHDKTGRQLAIVKSPSK